ncbi:MAG: type II toxin-antitoxin system VapC family toxin [Gemmatimonadaceae bacterium]
MSKAPDLPLLLDTHVWIWAAEQREEELSPRMLKLIDSASQRGPVFISAISMWEIAMLAERNRIVLSAEPLQWIERAANVPGVRVIELTPRIAVGSTRLPGSPHADPADRILMATARDIGARLVTRDRRILQYAESTRALAVLDANQ